MSSQGPGRPTGDPAYPVEPQAYPSSSPPPTRTRPRVRTILLGGLVVTGFLLSAAVLGVEFELGLGLQVTLLAALFAAIPLFVVVPTFLWVDRYEAEPTRLLLFAFGWGAICAPAGALFLNTGIQVAMRMAGSPDPDVTTAVFAAPLVEEGLKGLAVLIVVLARRREFDGVVDGIVYGGLAGAGFALTENILYLGRSYAEYGQQGLTEVFILRCIAGPFAHPLFTSCTGIGLGLAVAVMRTRWSRTLIAVAGYLMGALLHGVWNLSAVTGNIVSVYLTFQIPLFLGFLVLLLLLRLREARLMRLYLTQYADAGWFSHQEVQVLASVSMRRQARVWARQQGGRPAASALHGFQDTASDLALLRSRIVRGTAERDAPRHERDLLTNLVAQRHAYVDRLALGARP